MKKKIVSLILAMMMICQLAGISMAVSAEEAACTNGCPDAWYHTFLRCCDVDLECRKEEATCTTAESWIYSCPECGEDVFMVTADGEEPLGHDYEDVRVVKEATCTTQGIKKQTCTVCESSIYVKFYSHDYVESVVEATCGKAGLKTFTCECGDSYTEEIPATGEHTYADVIVPATCTEPEVTGSFCTVCNAQEPGTTVLESGEALGHDEQIEVIAQSCVSVTEKITCSRCDYKVEEESAIEGGEHTWGEGVVTEPTCTEGGKTTYTCTECGETKVENEVEALGHAYSDVVTAPTCSAGGYTTKVCGNCGDNYVVEGSETAAVETAHKWVNGTALREPTCTVNGVVKVVCEYCGKGNGYKTVPASHSYSEEVTTAPTCTEAGVKTFTCACGDSYTEEIPATGHSYTEEITTAPTCGVKGVKTFTCECGDSYTEEIAATGEHTYADVILPATCTEPEVTGSFCTVCNAQEPGTTVLESGEALGHDEQEEIIEENCLSITVKVTCSRCDYKVEEESAIEGGEHTWGEGVVTEPTCTEGGKTTYTCSECGETKVENEVEALGHTYSDVVTAPTCSAGGYTTKVCGNCGDNYVVEGSETAAVETAHKWVNGTALREPTCTVNGVVKVVCEYCGKGNGYKTITVDHTWNDGEVTTEPTCEEVGVLTITCTVCGTTKTEDIEATGHTWGNEIANEDATAVYKVCVVCEEIEIVTTFEGYDEETPVTHEHAYEAVVTAPTCTEAGYTTYTCECGSVYVADEVEATHTEEIVPAVDATCTEVGLTEGKVCTVCGETLVAQELVDALGHEWSEWTTIEDPENDNCHSRECTVCGEIEEEGAIPNEGAFPFNPEIAPSCTEKGGFTCSVCGNIYATVEALGHTEEIVPAVAATCTETGLTEGKICSVCGETLVAQEEVAALGHTEEVVEAVAATCTETGLTEGKICSVCGETLVAQEEVAALGHTEETVAGKAATCTETGLTEGKVCSVCGETLVAQEEVAAKGHNYTSKVVAPTCTTKGYTVYTCSCGHSYTADETAATGTHDYDVETEVIYANGRIMEKVIKTCKHCGHVE